MSPVRYTIHKVRDHGWGDAKWGIWDREHQTWEGDLGWFPTESAACAAVAMSREQKR